MRPIITIYLILIASFASAQFTEIKEKGKVGFMHGNELVKKPTYDSLFLGDKTIVTAYKKEKVFYLNKNGKIIYKGSIECTSPFINGSGILKNRKDKYALIQTNGDYLMDYLSKEKPLKYGRLVFVESPDGNKLFNSKNLLESRIDSVNARGVWLISSVTLQEKMTHTKQRKYLADKKETDQYYNSKLYNVDEGILKIEDISSYEIYANNLLVYQTGSPTALFTLDGRKEVTGIQEFEIIDSSLFSVLINDKRSIYYAHDLQPIITGDYNSFLLKSNTIYALGDTTKEFPDLDIYDYDGNLLITDIQYVSDLDENRIVFAMGWLQYIGTEFGEQLCGFYLGFGQEQNGYRIAYNSYSYRYINDQTYAIVSKEYPVIGRKKSTYLGSNHSRKGFIRTLVHDIVNTTRRFIDKSPANSYYSTDYDPNTINIIESGSGFQEGFAIVCLYGLRPDFQYDSLTLTENFASLKYNYIDTTGQLVDMEHYEECRPFHKGYAWVKDATYYYLIDQSGKKQKKFRFNGVRKDDNGYYIVRYRGRYGIVNSEYELVVPCEHSIITFEEGQYIETYFSEKTVIYKLPNLKSN